MKILIGNMFESNAKTLVNTVNCVGVMGKGVALEFKKRYPDMYKDYTVRCKAHHVRPGEPYLYRSFSENSVLNFPTKDHWRSSSKLSYITDGLSWFVDNYDRLGITSIAFPPLGCGNGGLTWEIVGPIMYHYLNPLPIDIEIYAPFGTKKEFLSPEFLEANLIHNPSEVLGARSVKFNQNWLLILEAIKRINSRKYVLATGRTMIQKIAYILTLEGADMGFVFQQGAYGPYCADVKTALTAFSNANLIVERPVGQMIRIDVTDNYNKLNVSYSNSDMIAVARTVDLFSRIKNTEHAELFTTIIYSYNKLKASETEVTEEKIYRHVIKWKPHWMKNENKNQTLMEAIRELALLKWISPVSTYGLLMEFDDFE